MIDNLDFLDMYEREQKRQSQLKERRAHEWEMADQERDEEDESLL